MVASSRRFLAALILVLAAVMTCAPRPASAVASNAYNLLDHAQVLVPSAACPNDPKTLARLPDSCFVLMRALKSTGEYNYFHPAHHWLRFQLPQAPLTEHWIVNVSTYVTDGELDVITADGRTIEHLTYGSQIPVADRPIFAHEEYLPIVSPVPPGATVVMSATTPFQVMTVFELRTQASFDAYNKAQMQSEALPLAFLNGLAVAMALFNIMLFVMLRRRLYLIYAAAILALVFYQLVETGAAWTMLWPHLSLRDDWPAYVAWAVYFVLIVAFTRAFLELPRVSKLMDRILVGVCALLVLESITYVLVPDTLTALGVFDQTDPIMTAIMMGTMLAAGVVAWRKGITAGPYFVLAFAGSTAGFMVAEAGTYDLYPSTLAQAYISTSIGAAWEAIFLALALGLRVREIEQTASRYEEYAYRDQLTGVANRRAFDEALEREWRRAQRSLSPLSVIIFDIDHFKDYNDRFGHLSGDERLISVAGAIAEAARRTGDFAARYGGEEFAMLLPGTEIEGALAIAESVRQSVRAEGDIQVTISAGCATMVPTADALSDASTLLAAADGALYTAKLTGRDRVCTPGDDLQAP